MSTDLMEKLVPRLLKPVLGLLLAVLGLAVLSGCGGPAEEGEASGGDGSGGEISLVAYSTPKEAYGELIPAFNKTPEGKDVKFTQSYGASGDQARAVESGLPADIVALSLAPDVDKLVEPGIVDGELGRQRHRRLRHQLRRRVRRPQGQPEEHQDLGRPDQGGRRGHHAEPVHLGRREVEPDGRLRRPARAGQVRGGGARLPQEAPAEHAGPGQVGPRGARHLLRRQGRRADLLRERGDHRAEGRRRPRLRDPGRDDPDREPGRGHQGGQVAREGEGVPGLPQDARGAEDLRRPRATGASSPSEVDKSTYPDPKKLFKIDKFGGWDKVNAEFFDPENGSVAKIEQDLGVSTAK